MSLADDEQIIKRRLQIDGEGTGDDRRINVLLKLFIKWCNEDSQNPEISMQLFNQMSLSEHAILKSELCEQMIDEEIKNYKKISDNIAEKIEIVKDEIEESKKHLIVAKEIRRNKLEYTNLARLIKEQPDRKEIIQKHETLKTELIKQYDEYNKINKALDLQRKNFFCFMQHAKQLSEALKDLNDEDMNMEEDGLDDDEVNIESMIIE